MRIFHLLCATLLKVSTKLGIHNAFSVTFACRIQGHFLISCRRVTRHATKICHTLNCLLFTLQVVLGALDVLVAFGPAIGQAPALLGALASQIFGFLSSISGGTSDSKLQGLMRQELNRLRREQLVDEGAGVGKAFNDWMVFMNAMGKKPELSSHEINHLSHVSVDWGNPKFLGTLESNIHQEKSKKMDSQAARQLLELIKLYCALSGMRELLLCQMILLVSNCHHKEKTEGIRKGNEKLISEQQKDSKVALEFLHRPSMNEIVLASVYNPVDHPEIAKYLKHLGVPDLPYPDPLSQELRVRKWPDHYLRIRRPLGVQFFDTDKAKRPRRNQNAEYQFKEKGSGLFRLQYRKNELKMAVPGDSGVSLLRVILTRDGTVLLSPRGKPGWFLYISRFWGVGLEGGKDPGSKGHWLLDMKYGDEKFRF